MVKCRKCGLQIEESDKFCMYCGESQKDRNSIDDGIIDSGKKHDKLNMYLLKFKKIITIKKVLYSMIGVAVITGIFIFTSNHHARIQKNSYTQSSSKNTSKESVQNEYIFPHSDKKVLTGNDIESIPKEKLAFARNEIFARHGYSFPKEPYKSYFNSKSWYKVNSSYSDDSKDLSPVERHNVKIILVAEGNGKNAAVDYDKDYYEKEIKMPSKYSSDYKDLKQFITNYLRYKSEAINKNSSALVSKYVSSNIKAAQKAAIKEESDKKIQKVLQDYSVTNISKEQNNVLKVITAEDYITFSNDNIKDINEKHTYSIKNINGNWLIYNIDAEEH